MLPDDSIRLCRVDIVARLPVIKIATGYPSEPRKFCRFHAAEI
jgi:hypothetical protein